MASDNKIKARVSSILFMTGIVVALFFIEFTFAENPPTVEVSDPFPEEMEIKDVVAETNKPSNSSSARNPDPKPKPPAPVNNNNSSEQLTDNTPDNSVSNPFGGQNGVEITPMDLVKEMKVMDKLGIVAPGIMEKDMETQKEKITQSPLTTIQTLAGMFVLNS